MRPNPADIFRGSIFPKPGEEEDLPRVYSASEDDVPFDADDAVPFVTEELWESSP